VFCFCLLVYQTLIIYLSFSLFQSYRAETYCEVLGITQSQTTELIRQYPEFAENVRGLIKEEYPGVQNVAVFEPRPQKEKTKQGGEESEESSQHDPDGGSATDTQGGSAGVPSAYSKKEWKEHAVTEKEQKRRASQWQRRLSH